MSQQSSVWRRSPFDTRFEQQFDALVRAGFGTGTGTGFTPAAEITRDGDDAVVTLDLPGVAIDDVTAGA